jgi:hypothetical protein
MAMGTEVLTQKARKSFEIDATHETTFEVYARDIFKSGGPIATCYPVAMDHCWHIPRPGELSNQVADPDVPQLLAE